MTTLFVADEHHRLHWHWAQTGERDLRLCHVDFHCDMRGLLIDRAGQRATLDDPAERAKVDQGNFLMHAVLDGRVRGLRWLHDPFGGRRHDQGTVRYESDLRVRLRRRAERPPEAWVPLHFREQPLLGWTGPDEGEHLDLDWDALASHHYSPALSDRLKRAVLDAPFRHRPEAVYFIYSFCSSIRDDRAFEDFLAALARKLDARVERLSPLPPEHSNLEAPGVHRQGLRTRVLAPLKRPQRWLTAWAKRVESGDDLAYPYPS
jgi:hypothetical protein